MYVLLFYILFIICLLIIIRLLCYIRFTKAISDFKKHNNDIIYLYKSEKKKNPLWIRVSNEVEKKTWKIMPKDLNNKGFIAFYPGSVNYSVLNSDSSTINRYDINLPIFRCRCQDCNIEFNCDTYCEYLLNIKNKYVLHSLLRNPRNQRKKNIFPKYCSDCDQKKKIGEKSLNTITLNDTNVDLDQDNTSLCYLCFVKKRDMKCFPCGCDCYCKNCSRKMVKKFKDKKKKNFVILRDDICNKCPICRSEITHFLKNKQD